jgi:hypothetical protein
MLTGIANIETRQQGKLMKAEVIIPPLAFPTARSRVTSSIDSGYSRRSRQSIVKAE